MRYLVIIGLLLAPLFAPAIEVLSPGQADELLGTLEQSDMKQGLVTISGERYTLDSKLVVYDRARKVISLDDVSTGAGLLYILDGGAPAEHRNSGSNTPVPGTIVEIHVINQ